VEAGNPTEDLAAFGKAVGDARFVALGEASHGTREFFQMKHRLLEYLVREKGFTVFAIEGNWPEALAVDRYIKNGEGDAAAGLAAMYFWTWQTEEVRDMVEWMRRYNQAPGPHPILTFTSFDMQTSRAAGERVVEYLKRYAPAEATTAAGVYERANGIAGTMSDPKAKEIADAANAVVKVFDAKRGEMEKASSLDEWRDARQAVVAYQAVFMRSGAAATAYRDEMMAANFEWLAREVHPKEKIVLWAHNGHVGIGGGFKSMGTWLREHLGRQYYVLGFAWRRGEVRAIGYTNGRDSGLNIHSAPAAPAGSGSAVLGMAEKPLFFLDMAGLPPDSALRKWLEQDHLYYDIGAVWQVGDAEANLSPEAPGKRYDGLIFVDEAHAARGLPPRR
jgi:erythromycin esterase